MIQLIFFSVSSIILYTVYTLLKVPEELKQVPRVPVLRLLWSLIRGEPFDDQFDCIVAPVLSKTGVARMWVFGRWQVIVSDFGLAQKILNSTDTIMKQPNDSLTKHQLLVKFLGESSIVLSDGGDWLRHRKVANPIFKRRINPQVLGKSIVEMAAMIENSKPVDMFDMFKKANMDTLGRAIFSHEFNALAKQGQGKTLEMYDGLINALFEPIYFIMPFLETLVPSRIAIHQTNVDFRSFLKNIIQERKASMNPNMEDDKEDLLTNLIRASESDQQINKEEVINNIATFFLAGHETSTGALTTAMFYLAKHPEIQEKARQEALATSNNEIPSFEQQKQLKYIDCIIKESMRIITTVNDYRRYCNETTYINDKLTIPKGSPVIIHAWAIHHDPALFPDPSTFNPDRFIDPQGSQSRHWMAFGSGPRMCKLT
ncbi:hypothetical protein DSO57_1028249 [Entomophthora muscae]|uniref:Uncharacterized protein n=1 Tax=Entomophthora muscae TaxID=34485 RepID=A0ACC2UBL4_9FUNG|nr:hypothetical protein DSO57_1028249 [Entomophthora muscae]